MKFKVGDKIRKPIGYKYNGIIVAVFTNLCGQVRVVAENTDSLGMLHIFNESQLELAESKPQEPV